MKNDNYPLGVGDVALDLAQGRPVHVINATGQTAAVWSDANNYELTENYGNGRLGADYDDLVFDVVYCSNAKSEPSKSYAMPESRLLRIETEAADDGVPVYQRAVRDVLEDVFLALPEDTVDAVMESLSSDYGQVVYTAHELADVEQTIGDEPTDPSSGEGFET